MDMMTLIGDGIKRMLGAGTSTNPYQIRTPAQLAALATTMNRRANQSGVYYIQTAHLDLSSYTNWTPIGTSANRFFGEYNGNGLGICNLNASGVRVALFGYVSGNLKNICVESGTISGTTEGSIVSGICVSTSPSTNASISGCINRASITGYTTATAACYISGILGYFGSDGSVSNCANFGTITNNSTSNEIKLSGGIIGNIQPGTRTITACFNAGAITGNGTLKAIAGGDGTVINSYFDSSTSSATDSLATGLATDNCRGLDALTNSGKLINLGAINWKQTAGYPVPIYTR